ncbi:MAG TPA: PEP-CTERM sorting domain-containing protein [Bryobacteraceae bacterium]|jgi:hypothetical protein|nr:PEP-CTERM sorting domain-containing protein [Bryobacteraceae bacterium]
MRNYSRVLFALLIGAAASAMCSADMLDPAYNPFYLTRISAGTSTTVRAPGTLDDGFETTILNATAPSVEAFASSGVGHGLSTADASLIYYFEITGAAGPVSLDNSAHFHLDFENQVNSGNYDSNANDTYFSVSDGIGCCAIESSSQGDPNLPYGTIGGSGDYQTTFHATAQANSIIMVSMEVQASGSGIGSGHALTDGVSIGFGDGFDATGYSMLFSSGVGNGDSATPEPGTVLLMLAGLGGIFFVRRISPGGDRAVQPRLCESPVAPIYGNNPLQEGSKSVHRCCVNQIAGLSGTCSRP